MSIRDTIAIDRDFIAVWKTLGKDERVTLLTLARRLATGQERYGRIDLANDPRDFRRERGEEIQDLLIYSAFLELQSMRSRDDEGNR